VISSASVPGDGAGSSRPSPRLVLDVSREHPSSKRDRIDQLVVVLLRLLDELRRDLDRLELLAERRLLVEHGLHLDEVDDAREVVLVADRDLSGTGFAPSRSRIDCTAAKRFALVVSILLMNAMRGTCTCPPAARPSRLRLDARDGVEDGNRTVEDAGCAQLDRKVHMAGRIDDVDPIVLARTPSLQPT
jgi:hypothetical protein